MILPQSPSCYVLYKKEIANSIAEQAGTRRPARVVLFQAYPLGYCGHGQYPGAGVDAQHDTQNHPGIIETAVLVCTLTPCYFKI